jgi:hypothetical protein
VKLGWVDFGGLIGRIDYEERSAEGVEPNWLFQEDAFSSETLA